MNNEKNESWGITWRAVCRVVTLGVTILSCFYLVRSTLVLSDKGVWMLTTMGFGGVNYELTKSVLQQRLFIQTGFILFSLSAIFQAYFLCTPVKIGDWGVSHRGIVIGLFITLMIVTISLYSTEKLNSKIPERAMKIHATYKQN